MPGTREVVIVAYSVEYVVMAINNARSIRRTNPGLTIRLIANAPESWRQTLEREVDVLDLRDEPDSANRSVKVDILAATRADRVLYLDADAEVHGDLGPGFVMLDHYDLLLRAFDLPSKFPHHLGPMLDGQLYPQYWSGMLFFRRSEPVAGLFQRWQQRYESAGLARDQPALARAVHDSTDLRILPMNAVWGIFSADVPRYPAARPQPRIYHYADVSNDATVLAACTRVLEELRASVPERSEWSEQLAGTARRFRRMRTVWYRSRLTNRAARRAWMIIDRLAGRPVMDVRKKRPQLAGRPLSGDGDGVLWPD